MRLLVSGDEALLILVIMLITEEYLNIRIYWWID